MLYQSVLAAGLIATAFSGPLSSCYDQANCLDFTTTELAELDENGKTQYEICMIYNDQLGKCDKDGPISHACTAGEDAMAEEGDKTEDWSSGTEGALCDIIPCGSHTSFGVKDGRSCEQDQFLYFQYYNDTDYIRCFDEGFSCGSKQQSKACEWLVFSPECDGNVTTPMPEEPDTTAADEEPATTAADEPDTTEPAADTTEADECADATEADCRVCWADEENSRECCGTIPCCEYTGGVCMLPSPSEGASVYVRDPRTDGNMNEDLVVPEEIIEEDASNSLVTEAPGSEPEEESYGSMVKIGFGAVMAIFAYLF